MILTSAQFYSLFKSWNLLLDKEDLTELEIINYINQNPNSRSAKAWQLVKNYEKDKDSNKLFKEIHQYSFAHSSSFFGLFKRTQNFSQGYDDVEHSTMYAEQGSRTRTIERTLTSLSI